MSSVFSLTWHHIASIWWCSLPSARQHPSYGDRLEVKREYYQNSSVLHCVTQNVHSQQHTYTSSSYKFNRLGLSDWDPYTVCRGSCIELHYCNMVAWFWWDSNLISKTTGFLQCFDTVGLVIRPVKIVPEMTYYVSSGTLNPTHSIYLVVYNTRKSLCGTLFGCCWQVLTFFGCKESIWCYNNKLDGSKRAKSSKLLTDE